jgi:hypothetical protein
VKPLPLRLFLAAVAGSSLVGAALVANQVKPAASAMTDTAARFLGSLSPEQKAKAAFAFDDPTRDKWFFTPQQQDKKPARKSTRKGVRLDELDAKQKAVALELLRAGLSGKGYDQATTIMSLETLLAELEGAKGENVRDPNWYFVSVYGEPSNTGPWSWRFEGHHLSINVTLDKGRVTDASPVVFGSNPAEVKQGSRKGLRPLPEIVDLAKELIASLNDEQRALARQAKPFAEIREGKPDAGVGPSVGVPAAKLNETQKATLTKLVEAYANRLPADVAAAELDKVVAAGPDKVHFGYSLDEDKPGKPYTYRVQGPTFVVEFVNEQADSAKNPANHIHSGWRRLPTDFAVGAGGGG